MPASDPIDPLERLLNLVALLLDHARPMTFDEIQEAMEGYEGNRAAAKRKFERDKDVLRAYGVPIDMEATDVWATETGYVIRPEAYYLPEIEFTPEQITALFVAAQHGTAASVASSGVRKLLYGAEGGLLTGTGDGPLVAGTEVDDLVLTSAADAAADHRRVRFGYRNARGEVGERDVDAWGVVFRRGHWYLVGRDRPRDQVRAYRLSRCTTEVADDGEGAPPPEGFKASDHVASGPWEATAADLATVAFAEPAAELALAGFQGAARAGSEGDRVVLTLPFADEDSLASLVLQYGSDAEVLSPPTLRSRMRVRLEELLEEERG